MAIVWQLIQRTWTVHGAMHVIAAALVTWFIWFLAGIGRAGSSGGRGG